ncbi:sugar transferase [Cytophagaceae bacterium DM2B3-1]|uniref:Sugar transferase n=2 Tax=Xanthocytophaga TaxID=3078918 RepID=A0AAE3QXH6_9BACT|nr:MULTISPECIES: sugar transferase [Xanthocytophaga]MDJ1473072.1 sugar transferase [Xanthocytophaga flavus]MDJ1484298.1 sugar transferase [Xanthocytophaga flavus]MDJ1495178.1 sugar transferase [Xanthocytophaga flavus]MDJ1503422.1 sugar transferase [Xanthocytophaga agilis]
MYRMYFKRLIDSIISVVLLILTLPFSLTAAILLSFANQGKIFFIQQRPGLHGKPFRIIKFKTMNDRRDASGELLPDAIRLTKIGRLVRKTSIDELPQLINVLRGDISLIGPRPLLMEYLPLYNETQRRRHEVRPGITGWAQVNGRNMLSWEKKFEYDVYYVDHVSLALDIKIFFLTILKIIQGEGISADNSATMEKFRGTNTSSQKELNN